MSNSIYLIQEREFINSGENVYKIGKTKQDNLKRFKQYPKGSKLLLQQICDDCDKLEKELIADFKNKFIHRKDIGNEYFEGDYKEMLKDIHNKITNNVVSIEESSEIYEIGEESSEIYKMFPNYKDDESFGGKKKLIKVLYEHNRNRIYTYYINYEKQLDNIFLQRYWFQKDAYDNSDYISKLLENNIIQDGMIYDFNDSCFIKKLNKHKVKISITYTEENIIDITSKFKTLDQNTIGFKIDRILYNNCLLNKEIYCDYINNTLDIEFILPYDNSLQTSYINVKSIKKLIDVIEFNTIKYDWLFLRKYTPYMIEINDNQYYLYNRDYQVIYTNDEKYSIENWNGKRIYLYKDESNPISSHHTQKERRKLINDMNSKYRDITLNKTCMNMNENTQMILNLYK